MADHAPISTPHDAHGALARVQAMIHDRVDPEAEELVAEVQSWLLGTPLGSMLVIGLDLEDPPVVGDHPPLARWDLP